MSKKDAKIKKTWIKKMQKRKNPYNGKRKTINPSKKMDQMPDIGSWDRHTWWRSKIQNAYLSENVLKETDQKYAKYVNVPYTRLQDFEAINLLLFLVLPSFILWKSVNVRNICKLTLCKKKLAEPLSWGICLYVFLEKHSTLARNVNYNKL